MPFSLSKVVVDTFAATMRDLIDWTGDPGTIRWFSGPAPDPDDPADPTTLLAETVLAWPCGDVEGGSLYFYGIAEDNYTRGGADVEWARVYDGADAPVFDFDITDVGGGGVVEMDDREIEPGKVFRVLSLQISFPRY